MKKITIYDISKKLGVSTATINRALSGKPRVSEETKKLIIETAEQMGFKPNKAATSLARKTIRIGFIINRHVLDFNIEVMNGAKRAYEELADFNVRGDFQIMDHSDSKTDVFRKMREMADLGYDGIILAPTNDLRGYSEVIQELYDKNVFVATVISDIPNSKRIFSVRSNSRMSGKIAGKLLWMLAKDKPVAIFTGTRDSEIHKESIDGFMEQIKASNMDVIAIYDNYDDLDIAYRATEKLLREFPDVGGIYIGTSNSTSVCKKIVDAGLTDQIKIVASDLFPELNDYLRQGVIQATIFQQPFQQGRLAFKKMYEYIGEAKRFEDIFLLKPQIVLDSNLELFID
ncbi:LacI family DNA-binding transcriptional regulator [Paenibacillus psychroresistens]|uniref:LacI family DNA-binding transcriptional regulator n=1 Tax=Paenibacillus psychroresistens TaxID=1778678 RepID=A0A6B8RCU1_9BACL|nr:LacI family DNA-binding transcriptional regulator [Paenibacillus psychroresistens]QGQ94281.1 LacI family DNA-binding transcriptional regulator [Paenibacillus psychroresistens]